MSRSLNTSSGPRHRASLEYRMSEKVNNFNNQFRVAVRAQDSGRYTYQIFTVAGEPRTFRSDSKSYATPDEAERAGYEAVAVLKGSPQ